MGRHVTSNVINRIPDASESLWDTWRKLIANRAPDLYEMLTGEELREITDDTVDASSL